MRKRLKRFKRASVLSGVVPVLVLASALPASAHFLSTGWVNTVSTGSFCMEQLALLSHGSGFPMGQFRGGNQTSTFIYGLNCRLAGQQLSTIKDMAVDTYVANAATNWNWAYCFGDSSFHRANVWRFEHDHWNAPCGPGWYTTDTESYAWFNGQWWGGFFGLWDGSGCPNNCVWYHWLP